MHIQLGAVRRRPQGKGKEAQAGSMFLANTIPKKGPVDIGCTHSY